MERLVNFTHVSRRASLERSVAPETKVTPSVPINAAATTRGETPRFRT